MATIVAAAGGGNWTATSTWTGGVVPTTADDVQLTSTSGNVTINAAAVCRSLDCTGYTGTLTHAAAVTLTIGDAASGAGNNALKFVAGMTYTLGDVITSALFFASLSGTTQTITSGGKTFANWSFTGTTTYQLTDSSTLGPTATVSLNRGGIDTNGQACSWGIFFSNTTNTKSLILGASNITITGTLSNASWNLANSANMTLSAGTSLITFTGANAGFQPGTFTYNNIVFAVTNGGANYLIGALTCANLTRTGAASRYDDFSIRGNLTVSGTLTVTGNSVLNRTFIETGAIGTTRTISAGTVSFAHCDFQDFTAAGSANWNLSAIPGNSGDCGGNSGITFTPAAAQTWSGTTGGLWSANAWTTRVPLPQDDVTIASAFITGQNVQADMSRLGKNVTWVGSTGTPAWSINIIFNSMYGSLTLIPGMTVVNTQPFNFHGRGTHTITSAGKSFGAAVTVASVGGSYTQQDALATTGTLTLSYGTLNTSGYNLSCSTFTSTAANTRSLLMNGSTVSLTSTAATTIWNVATASLTFSATSSTIAVTTASASARTFVGAGLTYGNLNYNVAGSTGALVVTGANTFAGISFSDATSPRTLTLPAGVTTTITSQFSMLGGVGRLMTLNSSTPGTAATLSKASGTVASDYMSLQDSTATGGATWSAGTHSTPVSNVTGWQYIAVPLNTAGNFLLFR